MDEYEQQADGAARPSAILAGRVILSEFKWSAVLRVAAHPFFPVVTVLVGASSMLLRGDLARVGPLFLMGTLIHPAVLGKLIPYPCDRHPGRAERRRYGVRLLPATGPPGSRPVHRLGHTNPLLWRTLGAHHAPRKADAANSGVNHVLDIVLVLAAVQLTPALIGFSGEPVFALGLFVMAQGHVIHANTDARMGPLNHILASPEQHRPRHSTDFTEAGHHGSDPSCWDRLFGSLTWRPGREPAAVGLGDPTSFPGTGEILASLLHPWHRARKPGSRPV
ncbi:sterol desaturase family protein [Streptomyces sp. NPDC001787]|uniref:sterol desaturase family protein n=1 Tax=Streptomyces sp. NPDC001787 TaxID=3154523 RepID=UPI00332BFE2F